MAGNGRWQQCVWIIVAVVLAGMSANAAPRVPGFERFHTAEDVSAADMGRLLVQELNCLGKSVV